MHVKQVERMSLEELDKFVRGKVCEVKGCYRECDSRYVVCIQHLHGTSQRADEVYVAAKKRLQKLRKSKGCGCGQH
jgi:hypothetical protein